MRFLIIAIISFGLALSATAQQKLQVGNTAPQFAAQGIDGSTYTLDQLHGKVVVMTFWSSRCPICHEEIPKLNRIAERYRGQDVVFLGLTMENEARVQPYLQRNPFNVTIVPNSFGVVLKYADMDGRGNINMGFPAYFVLDRAGGIQLKASGWDKTSNIDSKIANLLTN